MNEKFRCEDCPYYYKGQNDDWAYCHYNDSSWPAPCEEEDYDTEDVD